MDEPNIRLFVVKHRKKTLIYSEEALAILKADLEAEQYAQLEEKGEWREVWLHEALGKHEEEIASKCLIKDDKTGMRYDPSKEAAARLSVMVERWNGFSEAPSMTAYESMPLPLAKVLDALIRDHMYPSGLDNDFFGISSPPSES